MSQVVIRQNYENNRAVDSQPTSAIYSSNAYY